jgi:hypothetical protein
MRGLTRPRLLRYLRIWEVALKAAFISTLLSPFLSPSLNAQNTPSADHPEILSGSVRRVVFPSEAFFDESATLPRWDRGYLIARRLETFQAGVPNIRLYDQSGKRAREAAVWFPDSHRVVLRSVALTADGQIVAAGSSYKFDDRGSSFIAVIDSHGTLRTIPTDGFVPTSICVAPDGTLWSFGGTGDQLSQPNPGDMLRHFDLRKGHTASYLPRASFPSNLHPGPEVQAFIECSATEVSAYSPSANTFLKMKYADAAPQLYRVESAPDGKPTGLATTDAKQIYAYFWRRKPGGVSGLYQLSVHENDTIVHWIPVKGAVGSSADPGVVSGLWGSDGEDLVVSRADDSVGVAAIYWILLVSQELPN